MTLAKASGPLHFLADVALFYASQSSDKFDNRSLKDSHPSLLRRDATDLHISCSEPVRMSSIDARPLTRSHSSNATLIHAPEATLISKHRLAARGRKKTHKTPHHLKERLHMKNKRKELMEQAMRIKSLDNSPVNDRQLLVLRMVYDEITMYPSEPWMVLLAITIQRAFKQVKNWFSNERQKTRGGEVVVIQTEDGDKIRLRPAALRMCEEWSDDFFEEIIKVHYIRVLYTTQWEDRA